MRLAEHPFHTRRTRAATFNHCINFSTCPSSPQATTSTLPSSRFWRTRLVPVFRFVLRGVAESYALNSPVNQQLCRLSTLLLSLSLMDALQIHGKLRTMTPISLHRQKSKL